MNWLELFDLIHYFPAVFIFGYAALQDLKHGEVTNKLWLYTPYGILLMLVELFFVPKLILPYVVSAATFSLFSFSLYVLGRGRIFGGADAKSLIVLSLIVPFTPMIHGFITLTLPFALLFSGIFALAYGLATKKKAVKFLPFLFLGFTLTLLI